MSPETIEATIEACSFSEHDRDMATTGLCATFALALKAVFPDIQLGLIVANDDAGRPGIASDGHPLWRHAVAMWDGSLFDIYGNVELEHVIENFCWKSTTGGSLVEVDEAEMKRVALSDKRSFDAAYLEAWTVALSEASPRLSAPTRSTFA